jgi:hypothetical protein
MRAHRSLVFLLPLLLAAQNLHEFEKKVTEFTLTNGLHFIVVERHEAPVVSFHTYVNAGSVDDPAGATGIAHMFEHMAFKGTESIGSKNWPEEKKAIDQVEAVYDRLDAERDKGVKADPAEGRGARGGAEGRRRKGQLVRGAEPLPAHDRAEWRREHERRDLVGLY